jgi:hypothetical protein
LDDVGTPRTDRHGAVPRGDRRGPPPAGGGHHRSQRAPRGQDRHRAWKRTLASGPACDVVVPSCRSRP